MTQNTEKRYLLVVDRGGHNPVVTLAESLKITARASEIDNYLMKKWRDENTYILNKTFLYVLTILGLM